MDFEKLYMFNPFTIQNADSKQIAETYEQLQKELKQDTDTGYEISKNIEIYSNMNYLIGEMIARLQLQYDELKNTISITENKQIYMQRKQWQETQTEKAPAMSYFEAIAKEYVKEDSQKLAEINCKLFRFKKAYESIERKTKCLKKENRSNTI